MSIPELERLAVIDVRAISFTSAGTSILKVINISQSDGFVNMLFGVALIN